MITKEKRPRRITGVLSLLLILGSSPLFGGEADDSQEAPDITNIGFMENPPKELKEKFPMCDEFMNVEWIDKEKQIGYSYFDIWNRFHKKEERPAAALIHLDEIQHGPYYEIDVTEYRDTGRLEWLFARIREGEVVPGNTFLTIRYPDGNGHQYMEFTSVNGKRDLGGVSLADLRKTVCVPYPNNQRMWIAEGHRIDRVYAQNEIKMINEKIRFFIQNFSEGWDKYSYPIDINTDGLTDYVFGSALVYSYLDKYYEMQPLWKHELDDTYGHFSFPPSQKTCELNTPSAAYLTTDGQNYFLKNHCNLTDLTKAGE